MNTVPMLLRSLLLVCMVLASVSDFLPAAEPAVPWPAPHSVTKGQLAGFPVTVGPNPTAVRFFEERIRPVLVEHCFECHGNGHHKGGLKLDTLEHILDGGGNGQVLVPGDPTRGLLLPSLRWESDEEDMNMPPEAKLPDAVIADFETWIRLGAPWPAAPASGSASAAQASPAAPPLPPLVGRLHPLVVHFPIACLLLAVLAEALVIARGAAFRPALWLLLLCGTAGTLVAALTGSQLDPDSFGSAGERHEFLGWTTLIAGLLACALLAIAERFPGRRWIFRVVLLLTAALVGFTGHLGGILVYGKAWMGL